MQHWWQLATRNWPIRRPAGAGRRPWGRPLATVLSVLVGVAAVVVITTLQESARNAILELFVQEVLGGSAHLSIHPPGAHWGNLDENLTAEIAELENVAHITARLKRAVEAEPVREAGDEGHTTRIELDVTGIDAAREGPFLKLPQLQGRMIRPGEGGVLILEREVAEWWNLGLGARVRLLAQGVELEFEVIGLTQYRRMEQVQRPAAFVALKDLQQLKRQPGTASVIHILTEDHSAEAITATEARVQQLLDERHLPYRVESSAAQQQLFQQCDELTRMTLGLAAFIVLLTAFFIIVTTMSASLAQRRPQFGTLRCLGLTRGQLSVLLLIELTPLGVLGTLLGLATGLAVAKLLWVVVAAYDVALPELVVSGWGLKLAAGSGIVTTIIAAGVLIVQVVRVSPLAAVHTEAQPPRTARALMAGVVGLLSIALSEWMCRGPEAEAWLNPTYAFTGLIAGYLGYALIAPALIVVVGRPVARLVAPLLGLSPKLAVDPTCGRQSPWRPAGVCWMLLVGISLIVYISVRMESVMTLWNFPASLPKSFVWTQQYVRDAQVDEVRKLPGVTYCTALVDVNCELEPVRARTTSTSIVDRLIRRFTTPVFVAADPDELLRIMQIDLAEGTWEDARRKLPLGGYVMIPTQTATLHDLHVGDKVRISALDKSAEFEIVGVAHSAAFDLAVEFFQASSYMQLAGASAVLGTRDDLREKLGLDLVSLLLCNLEVPATPRPADFERSELPDPRDWRAVAEALIRWADAIPVEASPVTEHVPALRAWLEQAEGALLPPETFTLVQRTAEALRYSRNRLDYYTADEDWAAFCEKLLLTRIAETIDRPDAFTGSLERFAQWINRTLRQACRIFTWLPSIALAVAILGIANLMLVSVRARARELAILRAVGAVRSQILRLVLVEAVTLGLIGSGIGVVLGIRVAANVDAIVAELSGYSVEMVIPYSTLAAAVLLTVGVCLVAGLPPARYAARSNVLDALHAN